MHCCVSLARVGNVTALSIIVSFSFQIKYKDLMSLVLPSVQAQREQSRDRHSADACMYLQYTSRLTASPSSHTRVHTPHKHTPHHLHTHGAQNSAFEQSIANIKLITKHTVADSEAPDCHNKVRITFSQGSRSGRP